jgi:hypothetical protein
MHSYVTLQGGAWTDETYAATSLRAFAVTTWTGGFFGQWAHDEVAIAFKGVSNNNVNNCVLLL